MGAAETFRSAEARGATTARLPSPAPPAALASAQHLARRESRHDGQTPATGLWPAPRCQRSGRASQNSNDAPRSAPRRRRNVAKSSIIEPMS
jgi:hypothetical protein